MSGPFSRFFPAGDSSPNCYQCLRETSLLAAMLSVERGRVFFVVPMHG